MDATVKIESQNGTIAVTSPYHPDFIAESRKLNGKFSNGAWHFDPRIQDRVEATCRSIYGTAGEPTDTVTVRIDLDYLSFSGPAIYALGRLIAERKYRDYSAKIGPGLVITAGGFPKSGGSVKSPRPDPEIGTNVEVFDVPLALAERAVTDYPSAYTILDVKKLTPVTTDPRSDAIAQIREIMNEHGISIYDLK